MIIANLTQNARTAQQVIAGAVGQLPFDAHLRVRRRAEARDHHPARRGAGADCSRTLAPLIGKYLVPLRRTVWTRSEL